MTRLSRLAGLLAATLLSVLASCADQSGPPALSLRRVTFADVPGWSSDRLAEAMPALLAQCTRLARLPADTPLGGVAEAAQAAGTAASWQPACQAARALPRQDEASVRQYFETWFLPYQVSDRGDPTARVTGYFEPEFEGSLGPSATYAVPLYARPDDLVTVPNPEPGQPPVTGRRQGGLIQPYWTRAEIDRGVLRGRNLELLWLKSPVDLFFLQLQGSGRIRLPSGQIVRVGYAGRNGQPYVPLGRELVAEHQLAPDNVSMQSIRAWLAAHPAEAQAMLERNPNYVFFRALQGVSPEQGPPGALGVDLTPLRSAAVDRAFLPLGVPLFLQTTLPDGSAFDRLVLAQDLGTDITGPARADLFFGWGESAGAEAGSMHGSGSMVVLLPRQPASRGTS